MQITFKHPDTGKIKKLKVGWSWTLFFFSSVYGIPLFLRGLKPWGWLMFSIGILGAIRNFSVPNDVNFVDYALIAFFVIASIIFGFKGNELTRRQWLKNGWIPVDDKAKIQQDDLIHFNCPNCQVKYTAKPQQAGKQGTCKNCGVKIAVPNPDSYVPAIEDQRPALGEGKKKLLGGIVSTVAIITVALIFGGLGRECGNSVVRKFVSPHDSGKIAIELSEEAIDTKLQTISENFNTRCPLQADKYTTVLNTMVLSRKMVYSCKLDIKSLLRDTGLSLSELQEAQNQTMINNFCSNSDFDVLKQYDVVMEFKYHDLDGRDLFTFHIDKQVCNY